MRVMDGEVVYDSQIAPLVGQIIDICKRHSIPMVATFQLTGGEDPLFCSTVVPGGAAWLQAMQAIVCSAARSGG